jgi:hypothetical protein
MEVSRQPHASVTFTSCDNIQPGAHWIGRRLGEPQPIWTWWRRETCLPLPGIEPVASLCTD